MPPEPVSQAEQQKARRHDCRPARAQAATRLQTQTTPDSTRNQPPDPTLAPIRSIGLETQHLHTLTPLIQAFSTQSLRIRKLKSLCKNARHMPHSLLFNTTIPAVLTLLMGCASVPIHAKICTREYIPVCGQRDQAAPQIFANRCLMHAAQAQELPASACANLHVSQRMLLPATVHHPHPILGGDTNGQGSKTSAG